MNTFIHSLPDLIRQLMAGMLAFTLGGSAHMVFKVVRRRQRFDNLLIISSVSGITGLMMTFGLLAYLIETGPNFPIDWTVWVFTAGLGFVSFAVFGIFRCLSRYLRDSIDS